MKPPIGITDVQHKLITGDKFVRGLIELGLADHQTRRVTIDATVGEPIILTIEKYGDDRLLQLLSDGNVTIARTRPEAVAR